MSRANHTFHSTPVQSLHEELCCAASADEPDGGTPDRGGARYPSPGDRSGRVRLHRRDVAAFIGMLVGLCIGVLLWAAFVLAWRFMGALLR